MRKKRQTQRGDSRNIGALIAFQNYCQDHPRSPAAVRLPKIMARGDYWIVLLGANMKSGITGIGRTVPAALGAFDRQYLNTLRPPTERLDDSATAPSAAPSS